jgi:hypothetical protein
MGRSAIPIAVEYTSGDTTGISDQPTTHSHRGRPSLARIRSVIGGVGEVATPREPA